MRIKKKDLVFYFFMVSLLRPNVLAYIPVVDDLIVLSRYLCGLYIAGMLIVNREKYRVNALQVLLVAFFLSMVLATVLNKGDFLVALRSVYVQIVACLYFDYCIRKDSRYYIRLFGNLLFAYMVINAVMLIVFPNGVGGYLSGYHKTGPDSRLSFIGQDNGYSFFFILAFAVSYLDQNAKKRLYAILLMTLTMIYVFSGSGLATLFILWCYILLGWRQKGEKLLRFVPLTIIFLIMYIAIVFYSAQDQFSYIVETVLHKNLTFTGRVYLWQQAIEYIVREPVWGYGITSRFLQSASGSGDTYTAHNTILQILLSGGFVSLSLYLLSYFVSGFKLKFAKHKISSLLAVCIFAMMIVSMVEISLFRIEVYFLFILSYHIERIEENANPMAELPDTLQTMSD